MKCVSAFVKGGQPCADLERQADSNSFRERQQRKSIFQSCLRLLADRSLTVDPPSVNPGERATKLRSQQEVRRGSFHNSLATACF